MVESPGIVLNCDAHIQRSKTTFEMTFNTLKSM